jgi:hypothetical protein
MSDDPTLALELVLHCAWQAGYETEVIFPPAWENPAVPEITATTDASDA